MNNNDTPLVGEPLSQEDKLWQEQGRELIKGSIDAIESGGKQLITLITTMQGVYLATVAFSEISKNLDKISGVLHIALLVPMFFWLTALWFALRIFKTNKYTINLNQPGQIRETIGEIASEKQNNLNWAFVLIACGVLMSIIDVILYLIFYDAPKSI